jgi:hypothetical protein
VLRMCVMDTYPTADDFRYWRHRHQLANRYRVELEGSLSGHSFATSDAAQRYADRQGGRVVDRYGEGPTPWGPDRSDTAPERRTR